MTMVAVRNFIEVFLRSSYGDVLPSGRWGVLAYDSLVVGLWSTGVHPGEPELHSAWIANGDTLMIHRLFVSKNGQEVKIFRDLYGLDEGNKVLIPLPVMYGSYRRGVQDIDLGALTTGHTTR